MAIYTRTGDQGTTALRGDQDRVSKGSFQIGILGELDQLNATLGLSTSILTSFVPHLDQNQTQTVTQLNHQLQQIQNHLFEIGALVAEYNPRQDQPAEKLLNQLDQFQQPTTDLESSIDQQTHALPELRNFILPGGSVPGAHLHLARTQARQTERELIRWINTIDRPRGRRKTDDYQPIHQPRWSGVLAYTNRLSDWLFTAARTTNHLLQESETVWSASSSSESQ